ncbi:CheR family methyltransferase [Noviherbaspirillum saxi]|uniref:Chemotaxis protein n=1 Tax=Noviherbaspirillum saxi TaxID=2320863 RepID=A0A3A3G482_9BURK|nr:CheR family methyltransferase [Noviherbaspirillum saxi]RJF94990.1 chemotaxis protein [Noviherbaspirillum saxi]
MTADHSEQLVEDLEIDLLLEGVYRYFGHDFRGYQRESVKRRLHGLMQETGAATVSALQERVLHDPDAGAGLLRALSPRPTALFDDPAYYRSLRDVMVPWLRSCPSPKIWVAECVSAEEVCALDILLVEEGLHGRTQIFATAENPALLDEASSGRFAVERLPEYAENYRESGGRASLSDYCGRQQGRSIFSEELRSNITWAQYSLATDASFNEFQLIVCRHALPDFGAYLQRRTLQLFYESMPVFGILSVDRSDGLMAAPFVSRYKPLSMESGLYRRVG